jgi:hypothetical protein
MTASTDRRSASTNHHGDVLPVALGKVVAAGASGQQVRQARYWR